MHSETGSEARTAIVTHGSDAWSDLGPTRSASNTGRSARQPHPQVMKIVTELGLRYRPLATADQEAHTLAVGLLAKDLIDADPAKLTRAAQEWARNERFMPKACDLLAIIRKSGADNADRNSPANLERLAAKYNADPQTPRGLRWAVRGTELKLERA